MIERLIIKALEAAMNLPYMLKKKEEKQNNNETLLGTATHPYHRNRKELVFLTSQERSRHIFILGSTGSGKTKLIEGLIRNDILAGRGFGLLDPHGDITENILKYFASLAASTDSPKSIAEIGKNLILIEPFNRDMAVGFNPLEAREREQYPLVLELMGIFKKLWKDAHWGPRMDELLRNTLLTLASNKLTLLEAKMLLADSSFRQGLIENLSSTEVKEYWLYRYNKLSEKMQTVYREPILNRLSIFTSDSLIRSIIGQAKSTFSFRQAMDQGKWILINLSKGYLKENSKLLGGLFIAKLQNAAMSRVDMPESKRRPFYLFIDEFQNFVSEDFKTILSESRKYGLSLATACQTLSQMDTELKGAILGNVGTQIIFRLSHKDATSLSSELSPREKTAIERKLIDLKVREAILKRKGDRPRTLKTPYMADSQSSMEVIQQIKEASFSNYARPTKEVEKEIQKRVRAFNKVNSMEIEGFESKFAPPKDFNEGLDGWE